MSNKSIFILKKSIFIFQNKRAIDKPRKKEFLYEEKVNPQKGV